jgi:hypothetical protein
MANNSEWSILLTSGLAREESDVWVLANLPLGPLTEICSRSASASMRKIYNDKGADNPVEGKTDIAIRHPSREIMV